MIIDFHTHTHHSYDCMMDPARILRLAKERGLNAIVINDHNTIKGGMECAAKNSDSGLTVIVGAEIKTDIGDITGIFLKEEIRSCKYTDVIAEIKNQGGITILNHPFVGHRLDEMNFEGIDLIEGYNGRLTVQQNDMAIGLARKLSKPFIAGSDSHTYGEIANCRTFYNNPPDWLNPLKSEYKHCPVFATVKSQLIKALKKKDTILFAQVVLSSPGKIIKRIAG
ncbi:MAG: PHP domain-containing protein [Bacteroidetes bacterium]|nr:MAG: PHP domain-containing protein [Bacteroidota bacterium]